MSTDTPAAHRTASVSSVHTEHHMTGEQQWIVTEYIYSTTLPVCHNAHTIIMFYYSIFTFEKSEPVNVLLL